MKIRSIIIAIASIASFSAYSQIPNDYCTGAYSLPVQIEGYGIPVQGDINNSTPSFTVGSTCTSNSANDLWYKFEAISAVTILKSTSNQYITIYEENCAIPTSISCLFSFKALETEIGEVYYLRVIKNSSASNGNFSFTIEAKSTDNLVSNNNCSGAITAEVGIGSCGATIIYETINTSETDIPNNCTSSTFSDIWYSVVAPSTGTLEFTSLSGIFNAVSLYENDCINPSEVACEPNGSDQKNFFNLTPNSTYLLRLISSNSFSGTKEFCLKEGLPATNINCSSSELITISSNCTNSLQRDFVNTNSLSEMACSDSAEKDFWFEFESPSSGNITLENLGNTARFDIYTGDCNALTPIICSELNSSISYVTNLTPNTTHQLRIWQQGSTIENFDICITTNNNPTNNDCAGATSLTVQNGTCSSMESAIPVGSTFTGEQPPCTTTDIKTDAWYSFEATSQSIEFSGAPTFITKTLYTGSCGALIPYACVTGNIISGLVIGDEYYFQLASINPVEIDFCILSNSISNPLRDECTGATILTDGTFNINLEDAEINSENLPSCSFKPHDFWYQFTATTDNVKITELDNSGKTFVLYEGTNCNTLSELNCSNFDFVDDITYSNLTDGETYYLQVFDEEHNNFNTHTFDFEFVTPPVNDWCNGAISINVSSCNFSNNNAMDFSNASQSTVPLPTCISNTTIAYKDLWYEITVNPNGGFELKNNSSGFNEVGNLYSALYTLDCDNLSLIECGNTLQGNTTTYYDLNPSGVYYLRLLSSKSESGDFCTTYANIASNNTCNNAQPITIGIDHCISTITADLSTALSSGLSSSCITSKDVFYQFEMPKTSDVLITNIGSAKQYAIYSQSCENLTEIFCSEISISGGKTIPNLIEGETYILQVGSTSNSAGNFCIQTIPEISAESMCESAIPIEESIDNTCNNLMSGSTINASRSNGSFCGIPEAEAVFYSFTPLQSTYYTFDISNSSADHKIALYPDCTLQSTLACGQNKITTSLAAGSPTIVAIYPSIAGVSSSFDFCIYSTPETFSDHIGISTNNPQAKLDVNGGIKPGYSDNQIAGNIRWNGDLEVYDGLGWQSLVGWNHEATENIDMNNLRISNLNTPVSDHNAANKAYVDNHTDNDSDSNNEIQTLTKSGNTITLSEGGSVTIDNTTYSGADFALSNQSCPVGQVITQISANGNIVCSPDLSIDADSDPTNEIETWSTLSGIPAAFADGTDDVDDADNDPTNEIETWSTLSGIPAAFADGTDDVDDADNDPTNEIETWSTLAGIPAAFADNLDNVNDADSDISNELINSVARQGTEIVIKDAGAMHTIDLDTFSSAFVRTGTLVRNIDSNTDDFLFGATELPSTGIASGSLMLFDESKKAFRVGHILGEMWNTPNLGFYSFGTGYNTLSSGYYAAAFNRDTKAESSYSTAFGRYNEGGGLSGSWNTADPLFEVGIGTSSVPKNAFTIIKNGRVGIGDSSPGALLHVSSDGSGSVPQLTLTEEGVSDGARINFNNTNTTSNKWTLFGKSENTTANSEFNLFHTTTGNIITARGNGDVGIGGSPDIDFHVHHGNSASTSGMKIENNSNGSWIRMYVSSGSGDLRFYSTSQGTSIIGAINDVSGAYTALSDRRVKKGFESLHFDWNTFMQLEPLTYQFKKDTGNKLSIGMVAQNVQEIYPELITYHEENDLYHMDYSGVGVVAVKAVQELKKENEELKALLKSVMERLAKLENE